MFVSRNSLSGKSLSKLSCVCLPLGKLVNGKYFPVNGEHFPVNGEHFPVNGEHFPVNGKHFPVNKKHFRVKEKFGLVFRKVFSLWLCLFFRKVVSGKPLSKLSCVCLPLEKLVNGEHFPVNGKHFSVNKKHFRVKEKFGLVFKKVFSLWLCLFFQKVVSGKPLSKLSCVCLPLEKLVNGKHFPVKRKFGLVFRKVFSWKIWVENTFRKL